MAIRYDKQFNQEISRIVQNYNKKIARLSERGGQNLPSRIYVSQLKDQFVNRRDLKKELRLLQKFTARGGEERINVGEWSGSRYQYERLKSENRSTLYNLRREIKEVEAQEPLAAQGFRSDYLINLNRRFEIARMPLKLLNAAQLKQKLAVIQRDHDTAKRDQQFYDNMFDMLFRSAYQTKANREYIVNITSALHKLTPYQLSQAIELYPTLRDFADKYQVYTGVVSDEGKSNEELKSELEVSLKNLNDDLENILNYYRR